MELEKPYYHVSLFMNKRAIKGKLFKEYDDAGKYFEDNKKLYNYSEITYHHKSESVRRIINYKNTKIIEG